MTQLIFKVTGVKEMDAYVNRVVEAMQSAAPAALEDAAEISMSLMRKLVPTRTGRLKQTIRFAFKGGGEIITSKRRGSRASANPKSRVIGYIFAGDKSTLVGGGIKTAGSHSAGYKRKKKAVGKGAAGGRKRRLRGSRPFQNARLQEFGWQSEGGPVQHPFFFPAWRATRKRVKKAIGDDLSKVFRQVRSSAPSGATRKAA